MNAQDKLPFNDEAPVNPARDLRRQAYQAIKEYLAHSKTEQLDTAENRAWAAYAVSATDDDLYGAHMLLAKILMYKARFGNANYNVEEALKYKPDDIGATELKEAIEKARKNAMPAARTVVSLPEAFDASTPKEPDPRRLPAHGLPYMAAIPVTETAQTENHAVSIPKSTTSDWGWSELVEGINGMNDWHPK